MKIKTKTNKWDLFKLKSICTAAKLLQSCLTLCDPMDCSLPGFSVQGILQARTLQWVAISFSNAWKWKVQVKLLSHVQLLATLWTAAYQAPPSMGFSRQQYWSGVPLPSPICTAENTIKQKDNPQNGRKYLQWSNWQGINLQNIKADHVTLYQKNKQPNQKVDGRSKYTFFQRKKGFLTVIKWLVLGNHSSRAVSVLGFTLLSACLQQQHNLWLPLPL